LQFLEHYFTNQCLHHATRVVWQFINNFFIFIMQTGKVKFFNESKGFGFILDDASGEEIFVHVTGLNGVTIRENDQVSFNVTEGKKGLNAIDVQRIG
jgi:cold shock protein